MAILPATGSAIAMGKTHRAFTNIVPGAAGNANTSGTGGGQNIKLSAILGVGFGNVGYVAGTQIRFSQTFGGKTTPYSYL
jgi:hypothetical protein